MLALSDAPFARALFDWRRRYYRWRQQTDEAERCLARLPAGAPDHPLALAPAADTPATLHHALIGWTRHGLGEVVASAPKVLAHETRDHAAVPAVARYRERVAAGEDPLYALMDAYLGQAEGEEP